MRCVSCGKRNKGEPEDFGFRCPGCGHQVAFSRARDGFTDIAMRNAVEAVRADGRYRFLPEHPAYELVGRGLARANKRRKLAPIGAGLVLVALLLGVPFGVLPGVAGLVCLLLWWRRGRLVPRNAFRAAHEYLRLNPSDGLVADQAERVPGDAEVALAVSARRLLVCQQARYETYLLANEFDLHEACPVVGPEPEASRLYPGLVERMRQCQEVAVLVLHDLTPGGVDFARAVRDDARWFGGAAGAKVVDLGLSPGQETLASGLARPLSEIHGAGRGEAAGRDDGIELTALRPDRLMPMLGQSVLQGVPLVLLAAAAGASLDGASAGVDTE